MNTDLLNILLQKNTFTSCYEYFVINAIYNVMVDINKFYNLRYYHDDILPILQTNLNSFQIINIDINFEHTLVLSGGRDTGTAIMGNIEYNDHTYLIRVVNLDKLMDEDIVVDYSRPNIVNINSSDKVANIVKLSKKLLYIPPMLYPYDPRPGPGTGPGPRPRSIDCLTTFIYTNQPRRLKFLNLLKESGINNLNVSNCYKYDELRTLLKSTKIILNIHQTDQHHTAEELRILPALLNGIIVISEDVPLKEEIPYHEYIIWSSLQDIPSKYKEVYENYDKYYDKFFGLDSGLKEILKKMTDTMNNDIKEMLIKMN